MSFCCRLSVRRCLHTTVQVFRGKNAFYDPHKTATDPARENPDYFEKRAESLPIDDKYLENLTKLYQDKVSTAKDLLFKSDDHLVQHDNKFWLPEVDTSLPKMAYQDVDILSKAPESVKKIVSIEFGERKDLTAVWKEMIISQTRQHPHDDTSLESRVAKTTALIRHWTLLVSEIAKGTPKVQ